MNVDKLFEINGDVAIITGTSSGLGQIFADTLASKGAKLSLCARRVEKVEQFAKTLKDSYNTDVITSKVDVTDDIQLSKFISDTAQSFGKIDILVNNAGTGTIGESTKISKAEWQHTVDTNLVAVFIAAREAAKHMIKRNYGKIINIASIYGLVGDIFPVSSYYAAKGGVINLTRALAVEWAPNKINVNAIGPGFFPSEMTAELFADSKSHELLKSKTPLARTGEPDDLRGALLLLASHASDYITGQTLFVDGGWTSW